MGDWSDRGAESVGCDGNLGWDPERRGQLLEREGTGCAQRAATSLREMEGKRRVYGERNRRAGWTGLIGRMIATREGHYLHARRKAHV